MMGSNQKDIGLLRGRVIVFGGVYSNLQSLEQLRQISRVMGIGPKNIICTGDIVGYCAQPDECLRLVRDWGVQVITGNVEQQIRDDQDECGCNFESGTRCDVFAKSWYPFAREAVSPTMQDWLRTLPEFITFSYAGKRACVLHGGLDDPSQFIFSSTDWSTKQEIMERTNSEVILAGHCGLPFHTAIGGKHWLNAGVIGMPANDGTTRVWYLVLDDQSAFEYSHAAYEYDHETAALKMEKKGLPKSYAATLRTGIWDNCEILPPEETALQGVRISIDE